MNLARIIRKYLHAFNREDAGGTTACFVVPGVILDGMPPQLWSDGPGEDWPVGTEPPGAGDYFIALGEPRHEDAVDPGRLPASKSFHIGGRRVRQTGALFTVAVRQAEDGWRVAAWAWAKGAQGETEDHA
jgi:hypothetical protein